MDEIAKKKKMDRRGGETNDFPNLSAEAEMDEKGKKYSYWDSPPPIWNPEAGYEIEKTKTSDYMDDMLEFLRKNRDTDFWAPFRQTYGEPTENERNLMFKFMRKFDFFEEGFVADKHWEGVQKRFGPDIIDKLKKFLHEVRESKGYEVTDCIGFFGSPFMPMIVPEKGDVTYNAVMEAIELTIREMNVDPRMTKDGKSYELDSVDKFVMTSTRMFLLTFTVKEVAEAIPVLKTVRAMLFLEPPHKFELMEWNFKP